MVGLRRRHAHEAVPADAAREPGGSLRDHPSQPAAPQAAPARTHRRRQPADLQPLFPGEDGVCHGKSGHERADEGARDGFREAGVAGDGGY